MPGPVARADRLSRAGLSLLLGLCCLLSSCSSSVAPPAPAGSSSSAPRGAADTVRVLGEAVATRSRARFDSVISDRDPSFRRTADTIYADLTAAAVTSFTARLRPLESDLSPVRRALLGPDAEVHQVAVVWRVSGDVGPAEHLLWLTFVPRGSGWAIAGTTDGPGDRTASPIWLQGPLTVARSASTTVLAAAPGGAQRWLASGDSAVVAVRARLRSGLGARWNSRLVLEVPATRSAFERLLGVAAGSYAQIAAVSWPEGPDPATAALRIVVNPELAGGLDEQSLRILMTHEVTHVATRSAASPAPSWLVEGFADYVAYDAHPATAGRAEAQLLSRVRADGGPRALPDNSRFTPAAADLQRSYAEAWLACRYLADTYSPASLSRFYRAVDGGADVPAALQSVFGLTEREFTAKWAAQLSAAAQRDPGG